MWHGMPLIPKIIGSPCVLNSDTSSAPPNRPVFSILLSTLVFYCLMHSSSGQTLCYGADPSRSFNLGASGLISTSTQPTVLWTQHRTSINIDGSMTCSVKCVASGSRDDHSSTSYGTTLCGYTDCGNGPALVAYNIDTGSINFTSSELPTCDTTPIVALNSDGEVFVVTMSAAAGEMAAVNVDGGFVGDPISAPLTGAAPPAVTTNGVVIWLRNSGILAGYLVNGVPHASMRVPRPITAAAVGGPDGNSVFFISEVSDAVATHCVLIRVDVARTMNSRFSTIWQQTVQCPSMSTSAPNNVAPMAVTNDFVVFAGPYGVQRVAVLNGTIIDCVPIAKSIVTAIGVSSSAAYLVAPAARAIFRLPLGGNVPIRMSLHTVLGGLDDTLVGPIAVATNESGQEAIIVMTQRGFRKEISAASVLLDENDELYPLWNASLPGANMNANSPLGIALVTAGTAVESRPRIVFTVAGSVYAVGIP